MSNIRRDNEEVYSLSLRILLRVTASTANHLLCVGVSVSHTLSRDTDPLIGL